MKKFFATFVMMMVCVLSVMATDVYKVRFVKIGTGDRGTEVICEGSKTFYAPLRDFQLRSFFNTLRAGDIVEVEEYENKILGIRKIGHETPNTMTNGVIVDNANNYGGYYGGGYYGGGYASVETKNVGVGYDPYAGIHVRVNGTYVNLPIRFKNKRANNSGNYTVENNGGMVTANPATRPAVKTVKTVKASDLYGYSNQTVRTSSTVSTSSVSAPAKAKKVSRTTGCGYDLSSLAGM